MIKIIACGKLKEAWMKEAISEYQKRIKAYDKLEIIEVADEKAPEKNSDKQNQQVKVVEGERLLKQVGLKDYAILLDLQGKELTSPQFAEKIQECYTNSYSTITFIIGGSLGVSGEVIKRANYRWKLSALSLIHI